MLTEGFSGKYIPHILTCYLKKNYVQIGKASEGILTFKFVFIDMQKIAWHFDNIFHVGFQCSNIQVFSIF